MTLPKHEVITKREPTYPFRAYWVCVCGHRLKSNVMGPELYKEFRAHKGE